MRKIIYSLLTIFLFAHIAFAQDVSFNAEVNSTTTDLQSAVQLTLTVNGAQNVDQINLPPIDGFDARYQGTANQVSIINGQYSKQIKFNYSLFPQKIGTFEIPAFTVNIDGKPYTTQPIKLEVTQTTQPATAAASGATPQSDQAVDLKDRLFLQFKIPQDEVFINQKVPVRIFLFVNGLPVRDIQLPQIEQTGIKLAEIARPQQYQQVINGLRYDIVEFNTYFYPTRAGELELGPATLDCNLLYRNSHPGSASQFGSIFDDEFFGEFFDRYDKRPIRLQSPKQKVTVHDLPVEGQPTDFSGAVGQFDFNAEAGPAKVQAGDPITLRMTIKGDGNLASAQFPLLKENNLLKLYEPTIKEENGVKTFEQVVIPLTPEVKEIPAVSFSYFDPQLKQYRTTTKGPFPIEVTPAPPGEAAPMFSMPSVANVATPAAEESLGTDIIYLKSDIGQLRDKGKAFYKHLLFSILMFLIVIGWILFYVLYGVFLKMNSDQSYARKLLAPKKAKDSLRQLHGMTFNATDKDFYGLVYKTLQDYLSDKLTIPSGSVNYDLVIDHPKMKRFNKENALILKNIFDDCDTAQFASAVMGEQKRRATYDQLSTLIDYGQRVIK